MGIRTVVLLAALSLSALAVAGWWTSSTREARHRDAVEASLLRNWARSETEAGMSLVPKRAVPPASAGTLRALSDLPGFHEYAMRCSSCHVLPDPSARDTRRWGTTMERMRHHIQRSGTMPPPEEELEAALDFLRMASERRTTD